RRKERRKLHASYLRPAVDLKRQGEAAGYLPENLLTRNAPWQPAITIACVRTNPRAQGNVYSSKGRGTSSGGDNYAHLFDSRRRGCTRLWPRPSRRAQPTARKRRRGSWHRHHLQHVATGAAIREAPKFRRPA